MAEKEKYISAEEHHAQRGHKQSGQNKYLKPVLMIVGVLIIAGLSFYGGVKYQTNHQKTTAVSARSGNGFGGPNGFGGGRFGGQRPTLGQVTAISSSSITVQDQNGGSTTLSIGSNTNISNDGQTASSSDIKVGDTVAVIANSSDSGQAARILINPSFGGRFGSGGGSSTQPQTN